MGIHEDWVEKWREESEGWVEPSDISEECVQEWLEMMSQDIQASNDEVMEEELARMSGIVGGMVSTQVAGWSLNLVQRLEAQGVTTVPMVLMLGESPYYGMNIHTMQFEPGMLAEIVKDQLALLMKIGELSLGDGEGDDAGSE